MGFSRQELPRLCSSYGAFLRGQSYYRAGAVRELIYEEAGNCYYAVVQGGRRYEVRISLDGKGQLDSVECDCPAFYTQAGCCKHIAAALLAIDAIDEPAAQTADDELVEELLDSLASARESGKKVVKLEITLRLNTAGYRSGRPQHRVSLRAGESRMYVVKDVLKFIRAVLRQESFCFDMGLGKTVQAIALILSQRQESNGPLSPALVVAPASLIYNWEAEIKRFAPQLQVLVIAGTPAKRRELLSRAWGGEADVVIISYPLLRRDGAALARVEFSCLFFDEAQNIKNPHSQTAQWARKLQAKHRFALTGTPMENSLTELRSIFQAIMPGYLQSHNKFIQRYGILAEESSPRREEAAKTLAAKVRPFILRRLKKDVLAELPPMIEHRLLSELTREQKKLYLAYLERLRGEARQSLQEAGFEKSRIKILAGLTRLRQICCHPALFLEDYRGGSAKLEQLQELLRDAVGGGHRVLLFSQFTEMLRLIKEMLKREGLRFLYLDGTVKTADRLQLVEEFNNGGAPVFLISLRAGGTGLNLTGADVVVQYDLWWNPAVEEQAAGRAHRLGQEKVVQVIRLLAKDTIEEKIYALQQKKKELIEKVIRPGETFLAGMSEDDLKEILEL